MEPINCDFIPLEKLWSIAEEFRKEYVKNDEIPVNILDIIECDLLIDPVPKPDLYSKCGVDAFLASKGKELWVDQARYMGDNWLNRSRFTYAHELGHLYMHSDILNQMDFKTVEEWIKFRLANSETVGRYEFQSHEFAGRLLVPRPILLDEISKLRDKISEYLEQYDDSLDFIIEHIAGVICTKFGVSEQVINKRIRKEKILEELGII